MFNYLLKVLTNQYIYEKKVQIKKHKKLANAIFLNVHINTSSEKKMWPFKHLLKNRKMRLKNRKMRKEASVHYIQHWLRATICNKCKFKTVKQFVKNFIWKI
jgi:hypothetical protein